MPEDPEAMQAVMAAFGSWVATVGPAMVDPGAPLGPIKTVSSDGTEEAPATEPLGGYTMFEADSIDDAVRMVENHPFVGRGGSLQVSEVMQLG
jgi:hypothetical protein